MTLDRLLTAALAAVPFAAWAMPLVAPWTLALPILTAAAGSLLAAHRGSAMATVVVSLLTLAAILIGTLPLPLGSSVLALGILMHFGAGALTVAAAGMVLHTSAAATAEASLSSWLALLSLEAAGPALVAAVALAAATWLRPIAAVLTVPLSLALAWVAEALEVVPSSAMALGSFPVVAAVFFSTVTERPSSRFAALAACSLALATWIGTPPRATGDLHVVLPLAPDAFEARFFERYAESLTVAGIEATVTSDPSSIPPGATVLLPWVSVPFLKGDADGAADVGTLAREREWVVVAAGEHDGYGDVDSRLAQMARRPLLARDLTVPPGNRDASGPLRTAGLSPWHHNAALNRGASVAPPGLSGRMLLSGDGWWIEPHLGEWLWTGDYVWRAEDRGGRIPLAAAYEDHAARWVVVGDGSFMLNRHLVADPRPTLALVSLATLRPAFFGDVFVAAMAALASAALNSGRSRTASWPALSMAGFTAVACAFVMTTAPEKSSVLKSVTLGESGFDERNFNVALAEEPKLALSDWTLRRESNPLSGNVRSGPKRDVTFAHVQDEASFGTARLFECWRLGSLQVVDGPYLMDAQACRVEGDAEILAGTRDSAAVISVGEGKRRRILVLDTAFLSARAPESNRDWLLSAMAGRKEALP